MDDRQRMWDGNIFLEHILGKGKTSDSLQLFISFALLILYVYSIWVMEPQLLHFWVGQNRETNKRKQANSNNF